jgi:hypothetical protein
MKTMTSSNRFPIDRRMARGLGAAVWAFALIAGGDAGAQSAVQGVPNAMQGFRRTATSRFRSKPLRWS